MFNNKTMNSQNSPIQWSAPEFDASSAHPHAIIFLMGIFLAIVIYALIENSPIMAITFVLLGTVTFLHSRKPPQTLDCAITPESIIAGKEEYVFDNIASFWIIYETEEQSLFLKTKGSLISSVRIPLGNMNPNTVREALLGNIREVKYEPTLLDTLSRFLHI